MDKYKPYYEYPEYKNKEPPEEIKILCPFCSAPFSAKMLLDLESTTEGCSSCGYGAEASVAINIYCTNCARLVYRKTGVTTS